MERLLAHHEHAFLPPDPERVRVPVTQHGIGRPYPGKRRIQEA